MEISIYHPALATLLLNGWDLTSLILRHYRSFRPRQVTFIKQPQVTIPQVKLDAREKSRSHVPHIHINLNSRLIITRVSHLLRSLANSFIFYTNSTSMCSCSKKRASKLSNRETEAEWEAAEEKVGKGRGRSWGGPGQRRQVSATCGITT